MSRRLPILYPFLLAAACLLVFARAAYAQTPEPTPVTAITPLTAIGMVLGLLLGYLNHGVTTGTILTFGVPAAWKTALALAASFLTAFVPQFQQMSTVTGPGIFLAVFAGLSALMTYGAGGTIGLHLTTGKATALRMRAVGKALVAVIGLGMLVQTGACASLPAWEKAFKDVVSDIQNGDGLAQIEGDVAADLGFAGIVNTVVATFVVDAIDEAIALGLIPAALVPNAAAMEKAEAQKVVQMGGHLPTSVLLRHHTNEVAMLAQWSVQ
jgi:hypothetical protein